MENVAGGPNSQEQYSYTSIEFVEGDILLSYYVHQKAGSTSTGIETFSQQFFSAPVDWFYGVRTTSTAGADIKDCWRNSPFSLQAQLPPSLSGSWSVVSGTNYAFVDSLNPNTLFTGSNQLYTLVWKISRAGICIHQDSLVLDLTDCGPTPIDEYDVNSEQLASLTFAYSPEDKKLSIFNLDPRFLPASITMYDMNGRAILAGILAASDEDPEIDLSTLKLTSGIFLIEIISREQGSKKSAKLWIR